MAAQLIATNGPFARALALWSARAHSSFPVPLSPSSNTVVSVPAARSIAIITCRSATESPMMLGPPRRAAASSFSSRYSVIKRRCSSARDTSSSR